MTGGVGAIHLQVSAMPGWVVLKVSILVLHEGACRGLLTI